MQPNQTVPMPKHPPVEQLSDRAIAEETLQLLRAFGDMLTALGSNPMVAAMIPKGVLPK